jgi:hypothetical protein
MQLRDLCALAVSLLAAPLLLRADVIRADYFDEYHVVRTRALHAKGKGWFSLI